MVAVGDNRVLLQAASDKDKGGAAKAAKGGKDKPKSGGKKGKGGKTPEPPSIKGGTKLKKRGDEDEKVYIGEYHFLQTFYITFVIFHFAAVPSISISDVVILAEINYFVNLIFSWLIMLLFVFPHFATKT